MPLGYPSILLFLVISVLMSAGLVALPFFISRFVLKTNNPYRAKLSPYECGFAPSNERPSKFNVKFFLVGILFIIFDIEIAFLFPWALIVRQITTLGFISVMVFIAVLTLGLAYEFCMKSIDW